MDLTGTLCFLALSPSHSFVRSSLSLGTYLPQPRPMVDVVWCCYALVSNMVTQISDLPQGKACQPDRAAFCVQKDCSGCVHMLERGETAKCLLSGQYWHLPPGCRRHAGRGARWLSTCVCVSAVHGNRVAAKRLCHSLQGTKLRKGSICECACVCRYPIID